MANTAKVSCTATNMKIETAHNSDAPAILALQRLAYQSEAALYPGQQIPSLAQSLEDLLKDMSQMVFLKALVKEELVGSVRAGLKGNDWQIGCLIVSPKFQGQGIGTALLTTIEMAAPEQATHHVLFTGHLSHRNLELYERRGYQRFDQKTVTLGLDLVFLKKEVK